MNLKIPIALTLLAAGSILAAPGKADTRDMNILMIVAEDWSAFALGTYGNPVVQTPNLDRLAERGIRFDRAYCQGSVCNPSRASFMTGLRPDSTRVFGNGDVMDELVPEGAPSLAALLKQRGGPTAAIGKLVHKWEDAGRFAEGFDILEYTHDYDLPEDFPGQAAVVPAPEGGPVWAEDEALHLPEPHGSRLRELMEERDARLAAGEPDGWELRKPFQQYHAEQIGHANLPEEAMEDGRIARRSAELLSELAASDEPFFFAVGLYATHTPLLAPAKYVDLYDPEKISPSPARPELDRGIPDVARRFGRNYDIFNGLYPQFARTPEREREALAAYYACASYLDAQIGLILDALEETGEADRTIVLFFSDHGFHLGEHGMWSKFSLFEQSTRVPLIACVPGAAGNGRASDSIVELVDILPTLAGFWDLEVPPVVEGRDLSPLLENPDREVKQAAYTVIPIAGLGRMVRTRDFRYSEWRKDRSWPGRRAPAYARELYNLREDPLEQVNLINDPLYAQKLRELSRLLERGPDTLAP